MNDVLPAQIGAWQHLEGTVRNLLTAYGYEEIRVPIVEHTDLFKRAIGEFTDVVEKEMYTFTDRVGEPHAASRSDRRRHARGDLEWHVAAELAQALVHRPDVSS